MSIAYSAVRRLVRQPVWPRFLAFVLKHGRSATVASDPKRQLLLARLPEAERVCYALRVNFVTGDGGIEVQSVPLGSLDANVAASKSGQIDALYSSEGAALALVDSGLLRLLAPLSDVYPTPYTATVVWATEAAIQTRPDVVRRFVGASLEAAAYLKANRDYARDLYVRRTKAPAVPAEKVLASLAEALAPSGRGSGNDLVAAAADNWRFMIESGAVSPDPRLNVEAFVDTRFLPP